MVNKEEDVKYKDMKIEDIVVEFVPKSRQAIHSLLQHYKSTGNVEMVKKYLTIHRFIKFKKHFDERGFSASAGSNNGCNLSIGNKKIDIF